MLVSYARNWLFSVGSGPSRAGTNHAEPRVPLRSAHRPPVAVFLIVTVTLSRAEDVTVTVSERA